MKELIEETAKVIEAEEPSKKEPLVKGGRITALGSTVVPTNDIPGVAAVTGLGTPVIYVEEMLDGKYKATFGGGILYGMGDVERANKEELTSENAEDAVLRCKELAKKWIAALKSVGITEPIKGHIER